jgi:hypothetical protein
MVIDTSAVVAILFKEPDAGLYANALASAATRLISAVTRVELAFVVEGRWSGEPRVGVHVSRPFRMSAVSQPRGPLRGAPPYGAGPPSISAASLALWPPGPRNQQSRGAEGRTKAAAFHNGNCGGTAPNPASIGRIANFPAIPVISLITP